MKSVRVKETDACNEYRLRFTSNCRNCKRRNGVRVIMTDFVLSLAENKNTLERFRDREKEVHSLSDNDSTMLPKHKWPSGDWVAVLAKRPQHSVQYGFVPSPFCRYWVARESHWPGCWERRCAETCFLTQCDCLWPRRRTTGAPGAE